MTFYINEVQIKGISDWHHRCVGLFYFPNGYNIDGRGNFCGWYGAEYYLDCILVGYYVQTVDGGQPYDSKGYHHSNNTLVDKHYDEIQIGSGYWEEKVEFENPEVAILNFFEEKW